MLETEFAANVFIFNAGHSASRQIKLDLFAEAQDKFPVSPGHTPNIARRPVGRCHGLASDEKARMMVWFDLIRQHLVGTLTPTTDVFNFGINDGGAAGQTIP
jgi:diadenosine tetraphosphate (Ap4A) HIT family hydrolase